MTFASLTSLSALFQPAGNPIQLPPSDSYWLPAEGSTVAGGIDWLYMALYWISVISMVLIFVVMAWLIWKYRAPKRSSKDKPIIAETHNTPLEIAWSIPPFLVSIAVFVWGFQGYVDLRSPPRDSMEVQVVGQKWNWSFSYPNGCVDNTLHVPMNKNVRLVISSVDVLHSVFIPTMRVKMDAVPGRYTDLWFNATQSGDFPLLCTEYCGTSHSDMITHVVVHPTQAEYDVWVADCNKLPDDPIKAGEILFKKRGCETCHSIDGSVKTGPSFKGLVAKGTEQTSAGAVPIDENYLRESMLDPQAKIVNGFPPTMPSFKGQLKDTEIAALIQYIKSLK